MKINTGTGEAPNDADESRLPFPAGMPYCSRCRRQINWVLRRWRTLEGRARCDSGELHTPARVPWRP